MLEELLDYNEYFIKHKLYPPYVSSKQPRQRTAVLTCMDTRLLALLPAALGVKGGDIKLIRNAGALILGPHDTTIRSLLIAVVEFAIQDIMIIGHTDCGVGQLTPAHISAGLQERGVSADTIAAYQQENPDFTAWFTGFTAASAAVRRSTAILTAHPLLPDDVRVKGYVMETETGQLTAVE